VHRDIKPGNVMITTTGQVKVMDFGIARAISDSSATVAQTTAVLGTASYFSPEQAKGETVDARTDLYSTGVVLFEMLTGRPPFRGDTPVAVAYQHVSETAVAPSTVNPKVSPAMDVVVARALTKDRFERYQTVADFRHDLEEAAAGRVPVHKETDEFAETLFGAPPSSVSGPEAAFRQLAEDQTMVRTQRRPPVIWIWAGIAVMAVVIIAVLAWVLRLAPSTTMPDSSREVPNLSGQTLDKATKQLEDLKLKWTQSTEASSTYAEGQVIRTDPAAGIVVATGDTISVYVSTGKKAVAVPDVTNMTQDAAKQALQAAGLTLGPVTTQNSATVPANVVMETSPAAGSNAHEGDAIGLTVSSGKVTLTDLTGQSLPAATSLLQQLGLTADPKADTSCKQNSGAPLVHTQTVAPGDVPQGSTVGLTYCSG
jgi:serine/threonine-protein kinase